MQLHTFPGYPNGRPFRQYCEWRITVPKGRRVRADILDFDFGESPTNDQMMQFRSRISVFQSLTFYNDFTYTSRIKRLWRNETGEPVYSSDNRMLITLWLRHNAGHRGFRLSFSSDEPTICAGDLNSNEGTIESPKNSSSYYCEYQRDQSRPFIRGETNVGTMGIYITESATTTVSYCPILSPINVQYLPFTRNRIFRKVCNMTSEFPPVASPFTEVKIGAKKGGYHAEVGPYTINYKINNCGRLIKDTQEITIRNPTFPPNYGRVACAWQYNTVENAPIAVSFSICGIRFSVLVLCRLNGICYNGTYTSPDICKLWKYRLCDWIY